MSNFLEDEDLIPLDVLLPPWTMIQWRPTKNIVSLILRFVYWPYFIRVSIIVLFCAKTHHYPFLLIDGIIHYHYYYYYSRFHCSWCSWRGCSCIYQWLLIRRSRTHQRNYYFSRYFYWCIYPYYYLYYYRCKYNDDNIIITTMTMMMMMSTYRQLKTGELETDDDDDGEMWRAKLSYKLHKKRNTT